VAKTKLQVSKVLVKAIALSFVTILTVTIILGLGLFLYPDSAYHKILNWQMLNHFNPEVYYTQYYRNLSLIANEEDWMIVTPIAYIFGGLVFGYIISSKRDRNYTLYTSAITALVFTAGVLYLCYLSNGLLETQSQRMGVDLRTPPYNEHELVMGIVQTVYWTVVFVVGSTVGLLMRSYKVKRGSQLPQPLPTA
jgi:hypothetical protein